MYKMVKILQGNKNINLISGPEFCPDYIKKFGRSSSHIASSFFPFVFLFLSFIFCTPRGIGFTALKTKVSKFNFNYTKF